jgi:hypothetical protein
MISSREARPSPLRRIIVGALLATGAATLALVLIALVTPARTALALHWYLVGIGAIAAFTAIRALIARYPVLWQATDPTSVPRPPTSDLPARLRAIHSLVTRSRWDAAGWQTELRPLLRTIAAQRLATYRTIDIDGDAEAARAVLGERAWALLGPAVPETARGDGVVDLAELRATVERLETLHVNAVD